jgi:hypothetical protein
MPILIHHQIIALLKENEIQIEIFDTAFHTICTKMETKWKE